MKRLLLAMCVIVAAMVLAACGGSTTSTGGDESGGDSGGGDKKGGKIQVGLVTDQGGLNDRSFNTLANQGLEKAKSELGIDGQPLESKSSADYEPNLGQFVGQDYDLIVAVGFLMSDPVKSVAAKSPKSNFAIIDFSFSDKPIPNVRGLLFKEEEAGYLAGALAGMVEEEGKLKGLNGPKVVSSVGGQKIPPVDKYIAGFQAGVKAHCKSCKVLNAYSQDFIAQDKCKEQALTQISQGSDIIFQVAGGCGLGALDAANSKGVWGIGVDADQAYLGPHILTSALKRVDVAVYDTIKAALEGNFEGGTDAVYGLSEDGVGLGKVAPAAQAYEPRLAKVMADIKAGKIEIPTEVKK